jgi:D-arabinose 1-dehydrogenase-like Zn-dependent alcohol dehydrogenase
VHGHHRLATHSVVELHIRLYAGVLAAELVEHRHQDVAERRARAHNGSLIGGIAETQEMLDFCGQHGIHADIEVIRIQDINEARECMLKADVKYRFVTEMASLKEEVLAGAGRS